MRTVAGRGVVVVAAPPLRVEADGPTADRCPARSAARSPAAQVAIGMSDRTRSGIHHAPLEHLHAAHRAADDASASARSRGGRRARPAVRTMSRIVTDREARRRRDGRSPGRSTPGRSMPWQPPSTLAHTTKSGRCRAAGRGRRRPPTSRAAAWPGTGRPGGVAVAGPGVADEDGVARRRRRARPRSRTRRRCRGASRRPRGRTAGRRRAEELAPADGVAGPPGSRRRRRRDARGQRRRSLRLIAPSLSRRVNSSVRVRREPGHFVAAG